MKPATIELLACPGCHKRLEFRGRRGDPILRGALGCEECTRSFPIVNGIPHFVRPDELRGLNRRIAYLYDWFSLVYDPFMKLAFAVMGVSEEQGRREMLDRLEPRGGRVLEVSIGTGGNLPFLLRRADVGEVYGLDISSGQLRRCEHLVRRKGWTVDLFLGNAEQLPFGDETFDSVFHFGGINFFDNKKAAIDEMVRVAKPGTRILMGDETEKGARAEEAILPGMRRSFKNKRPAVVPPVELVPESMRGVRLSEICKGWIYCLEFTKP
jgi:ubiquinone/menaquinone biosynthesis C-methylase UbiE/uncharacterized protein YbaR (Trm112 family)